MKANPRARALRTRSIHFVPVLAAAMLAGCIPQRPAPPAPTPTPSQTLPARPAPTPAATQAPTPQTPDNWRDMPMTPGDWQWSLVGASSTARYADGLFTMRCNASQGTVSLIRAATSARPGAAMAVTTMDGTRTLTTRTADSGIEAVLPARDPLLDAMAFTRGRFALAVSGEQTLYIPSWTEVSRVIEDCR